MGGSARGPARTGLQRRPTHARAGRPTRLKAVARLPMPTAPEARRIDAARDRVFHPACVEGRAPAPLVVTGELEVVALARHAALDVRRYRARSRARSGERQARQISVDASGFERDEEQASEAVTRGRGLAGQHALLDDVVRPPQ